MLHTTSTVMKYKKALFIAALLGMQLNGHIDYYDGLNDGVKTGKVKSVTGNSPGIKVPVGRDGQKINS